MVKGELLSKNENIQRVYDWYLDGQFFVNRKYQRKLVWTLEEKQKLVNSIANDFPIPLFLLAKSDESTYYEIIDGMQRLEAVFSFICGDFPVEIGDQKGYFDLNTMAKSKELLDNGILRQHTPILDRKICVNISNYQLSLSICSFDSVHVEEIFRRINATGRQLSDQDLRQAGATGAFSDLVRTLACYVRRDSSKTDVLELSKMKEISLSNRKLNYGIDLRSVFWVRQGIILLSNMRISRDEELVAYLLMYILLGKLVNPTANNLNKIYGYDAEDSSNLVVKVISSIKNHGEESIKNTFINVFDELEKVCSYNDKPLNQVLFGNHSERMMRSFQILYLSIYELLICDNKSIKNHKALAASLSGLGTRHLRGISSDNWNASFRNEKIKVIKSIVAEHFEDNLNNTAPTRNLSMSRLENLLMQSKTEHQLFDIKVGLHSLDEKCKFNESCLKKVVKTLVAMANTNSEAVGYVLLGIADNNEDAEMFQKLYGTVPLEYNSFCISGLQEEIKNKYNSEDDYLNKIRQFIEHEPIDQYTKSCILGNMRLIDYYGKCILLFEIKSAQQPLLYGNDFFERRGSNVHKLEGESLRPLFDRFK